MIQEIFVVIIFIAAILYLGKIILKNFKATDSGCSKGCCGVVDNEKSIKLKNK